MKNTFPKGYKGRISFFLLLGVILLACGGNAAAQPVSTPHVEAELIAEVDAIQPGRPFRAALRLRMEKEWHTYWRNPGDAGMATAIEWTLPEGFTAGEIEWPYPELMGEAPEVSYGYGDEIILPVTITPPAGLAVGSDVKLVAAASWLVCKEVCIPGGAELSLKIPVTAEPFRHPPRWRPAFDAIGSRMPRPLDGWKATAYRTGKGFRLRLVPDRPSLPSPTAVTFFAGEESVIDHSAPQEMVMADGAITIDLALSPYSSSPAERLRGLLYTPGSWNAEGTVRAMEIDIPVESGSGGM